MTLNFNINIYNHADEETKQLLLTIKNQNQSIMATLDQVLASVTENETVGDSIVTLLNSIKTRLDEALSGTNLPPAVQAKVDAIFASSERDKQKLADAIVANTPNETPTEPPIE